MAVRVWFPMFWMGWPEPPFTPPLKIDGLYQVGKEVNWLLFSRSSASSHHLTDTFSKHEIFPENFSTFSVPREKEEEDIYPRHSSLSFLLLLKHTQRGAARERGSISFSHSTLHFSHGRVTPNLVALGPKSYAISRLRASGFALPTYNTFLS